MDPLATATTGFDSALRNWGPHLLTLATLWMVVKSVYNLYFHPLARFPGPRFAAASSWWQVYIEVITEQSLSLKLWELHSIYGDVIRIGPNELHFARLSAYQEIYNMKNRWDRDMKLYHIFADEQSTLTIPDYARAKKRRDITSSFFSRKSIVDLQDRIQDCLDSMCENIDKHIDQKKPFNLLFAFRSCAMDVIFSMCFARELNATKEPGFSSPILHALHAAIPITMLFKHFPLIQKMVYYIPPGLLMHLRPEVTGVLKLRKMLEDQIKEVKSDPQSLADHPHPTIYHEFLKDPKNTPSDLALRDEAVLYTTAGSDTVSDSFTVGAVNVVGNPEIHAKLVNELMSAWPSLEDTPRFEVFEKLPYLTAVLKESLRFSNGVVQPMTRVVPAAGAHISGQFVPSGTIVGMSNIFVHRNEEVFPDHQTFRPERWLENDKDLDGYLVAFSKGPRSCIGINLGWCELYMGFANLFRRYELTLDGYQPSDWRWRDCYLPHYEGPDVLVRAKPRTA